MTVTTLAPWFGSNRMLASHVGAKLTGCEWVGVVFAGGMSEVRHIKARTLVVNDKHRAIINLARVVADPVLGPKLYRQLRRCTFHPDELENAQSVAAERDADSYLYGNQAIDTLDFARAYFIAAWMGRSGQAGTDGETRGKPAIRWNATGGDSAVRFQSAVSGLVEWRRVLRRATFTTLDCFDFLDKCKDEAGHGIYCDPPFPDAGDAYKHKFSYQMHERLASRLAEFKRARVVCRFYEHPLVAKLYPESAWTWHRLEGRKQTNDAAPEVLLINGPSVAGEGE